MEKRTDLALSFFNKNKIYFQLGSYILKRSISNIFLQFKMDLEYFGRQLFNSVVKGKQICVLLFFC